MPSTWTFHSAGELLFGPAAVQQLGEVASRLGLRRVFVVTDPVLRAAGLVEQVREPLTVAGVTVEVFDGGEPEPSLRAAGACNAAACIFRPDGLLGLGGGSNMDLAKVAALVVAHGGTPEDYVGDGSVPGPVLPIVCVPTTAGTGSEVSSAAVLTDTERRLKVGILSNYLRPRAAIVDPLLTRTCPPRVTADSGLDALTHAIEAYTAVDNADFPLKPGARSVFQGRHPLGDCLAERAIALVGRHLRRAVADGTDQEAREGMALAATLAGLAFSNVGVAVVHALEHALGAEIGCSHGTGNGLLLPHVMRYNLPVRRREMAAVARLLGEDVAGLDDDMAAAQAVAVVDRLRADVGVPGRLRELGARHDQLHGFAEKAFAVKRVLRVNPRVPTVEDLQAILHAAF